MLIATKAPHGNKGIAIPAPRHAGLFTNVSLPNNPAFNEQDVSDKPGWLRNSKSLDTNTQERLTQGYRTELQSLQAVDDLVEGLVSALQSVGKLNDTVIIFTSDNGFMYGDHRLTANIMPHEESIRVPLVMRGPGIPEHQLRTQLVNNLDVVATIEELAGVVPGIAPDGHTLTPLFVDANAPWRNAILVEGSHDHRNPKRSFMAVRTTTKVCQIW